MRKIANTIIRGGGIIVGGAIFITMTVYELLKFWPAIIAGAVAFYFQFRTTAYCLFGLAVWNLTVGNAIKSWLQAQQQQRIDDPIRAAFRDRGLID
jgi:hypothetical protein